MAASTAKKEILIENADLQRGEIVDHPFRKVLVIVSEGNGGWLNVSAVWPSSPSSRKGWTYGYNIQQRRWAYGQAPDPRVQAAAHQLDLRIPEPR